MQRMFYSIVVIALMLTGLMGLANGESRVVCGLCFFVGGLYADKAASSEKDK